ncbi:2-dehydropantoate 2-reductase [Herbiconiux sp. CPCC 205763]|uniref:2-dehydropantoate 2-reductase n=1 Tax=Herbiconiux aconitum TaxID=2970913 RepID=A0ABT2GNV7_9MICO|nr:2-dehydropantoate 2-reductase [Herbiconiux aconitum]MCS5716985.1 2-dehydropantoate 2-reductase [Herbiconiux aconitum]
MRTLIVGAGAIGGFFGSRLIAAGRDVTFLARENRAESLRRDGLRIAGRVPGDGPDAVETFAGIRAISAGEHDSFDLVLLAVKSYALHGVIDDIAPFVGPETTVLPLLNGLKHIDTLKERYGAESVIGGLCVASSQLTGDGTVRLLAPGTSMTYGELDGSMTERIRAVDETLRVPDRDGAEYKARLSEDILADMWVKWVFLASGGAVTTLMGGPVGRVAATPTGPETARAIVEECAAVAAASGYPMSERVVETATERVTEQGSPFTTSMYRDLEEGRPIEVESVIGDLVDRGGALGVATPLLGACYARLCVYASSLQ